MATLDDLKAILLKRGGFTAVEAKATDTQIRLEGRVPPNASQHWILVARALLIAGGKSSWSVDYSKHYFVRDNGKILYAHRLIFQGQGIKESITEIIKTIHTAPFPARVELQEVPLIGAGAHRESTGGRGAYSVDRAPLAPAMRMGQIMRGGNQ